MPSFLLELLILAGTLVLYLLTGWSLFAFLIFLEMIAMVVIEIREGIKKHGVKGELKDTAIAILVVGGFWIILVLLLNTSSPVNAIVTCSMVPYMDRGDLVILRGEEPSAPEIEMDEEELEEFLNEEVVVNVDNITVKGSLWAYCSYYKNELCTEFITNPEAFEERKGPVVVKYAPCSRMYENGTEERTVCLSYIEYNGETIKENKNNDIVLYTTDKSEYYGGLEIIHRLFMKIKTSKGTYYVMKGDNNPILDIQVYDYFTGKKNEIKEREDLKGKVLLRIPYLGYYKLFLFGFFEEDPYCNSFIKLE